MRRVGALLGVLLLTSGCGVGWHTPEAASTVTQTVTTAPPVPGRQLPVLPVVNEEPLTAPGQTVITLAFDDGRSSDVAAARITNAYGLRGTFFINSGNIGMKGWMTLDDLDGIAASSGNEIGGHTVDHDDLSKRDPTGQRTEVCEDRDNLLKWGFPARNFAYPFGYYTPDLERIVQSCGYNSGRGLGELTTDSESIPPQDPYRTRSAQMIEATTTAQDMENVVETAIKATGWVQLLFHGICPTDCTQITPTVTTFTEFIRWLADQQAQGRVLVRTVGEVIGGPVQPAPQWTP